MIDRRDPDIIIAGAGAVGALLGHALAMRGFEIAMIDAAGADPRTSVRTSALSRASLRRLSHFGLWPLDGVEAAPLRALQIIDRSGYGRLSFDSADIGEADLGVIVNHSRLESALRAKAQVRGVSWHQDRAWEVEIQDTRVEVAMKGGGRLRAPLLIAADGAQSVIREQLGVAVFQYHYGQTAVCADIRLGHAHDGVAWQRFLAHGPCALLPLPDACRASLIWSATDDEARRLRNLSDTQFAAALNDALAVRVSERALIILDPIVGSFAHDGTSPQRTRRIWRTGAASGSSRGGRSSTTRMPCMGATFQDGSRSSPRTCWTNRARAISSSRRKLAYLPHIGPGSHPRRGSASVQRRTTCSACTQANPIRTRTSRTCTCTS